MLTYDMSQRIEQPLYVYLYECMRADIECGTISAGEKLPSKRKLAEHLGVSIVTVEGAYRQLIAEGYVESRARRGYYAAKIRPTRTTQTAHDVTNSTHGGGIATNRAFRFDLSKGTMPSELFPVASWSKALRDTLTQEAAHTLVEESDPMGRMELREQISAYLHQTRGLLAPPENIVVGSGAQTLYNLIVQLLGRNISVGVEDPGYPRLTKVYQSNGVETEHIPLDAAGLSMQHVRASKANVLHITPSHQFPTGIVTNVSRRHELLGWACEKPGRYIIEDDYDCEFRLAGRPIPTLQGIDASERVIYTNTFSKSLGAAFRIAYMVLPSHLAKRYQEEMSFYSCTVPAIDQLALARFMQRGEFERHVNRLRTHARDVRDAFLAQLKKEMSEGSYEVSGQDAGLHFMLEFPNVDKHVFAKVLEAQSIRMPLIDEFAENKPTNDDASARFVVQYLQLSREKAENVAAAIAAVFLAHTVLR